ncbi:type II toxin-antitoxin system RelE/ParE family toxin [Streptomyces sp. NPDC087658]|uniref:type II toxin-antitoxin system RelE family toxin n=1 Tax=Streptomyces sp. NPDC087658 TaxID=3365800 RepID=UPI00380795EF
MGHTTRFSPHAQSDMLKIPRPDAIRILQRLAALRKAMDQGDTSAFGIKALQGHHARWRLRVGDHRAVYTVERAVYTVEDGQPLVRVSAVGHRREIYRSM